MIKYLILGDIHGRHFWKNPVNDVLENTDANIVFLGDYLDCYPNDFEVKTNYVDSAINNFEEILKTKNKFPERITLLIGNHDCTYRYGKYICECRTDYRNYNTIRDIFLLNKDLFQLADETIINGKHFIFSHAGIHKGYIKYAFPDICDSIDENNIVDYVNKAYRAEDEAFIKSLGMYDRYRGWGGYDYASLVWADLHSWFESDRNDGYGYQVFGHTQLKHGCGGCIAKHIACLDSAEPFVITEEGEITQYNE